MSNITIANLSTKNSQSLLEDLTIQEVDNILGGLFFPHDGWCGTPYPLPYPFPVRTTWLS